MFVELKKTNLEKNTNNIGLGSKKFFFWRGINV